MILSNKSRVFFFVSLLSAIFIFTPAHAEDTALILDFADWLHAGGDDVSAEAEYLRYLFVTGSPDRARRFCPRFHIPRTGRQRKTAFAFGKIFSVDQ